MKRFLAMIAMVLGFALASNAMSYDQAREQALFLTDKMAYELNLTDEQYEAAYEINLDYLMSINSYDDLYSDYWRWRNLDLSYVLLDWQYRAFCDAAYFYRPLYFDAGCWHFAIYARYPHRDYFFFHRPTVYVSYRGAHSWRMNNGRSWYHGRSFGSRRGGEFFGMRDGFNRGDYGRGNRQQFGSRPSAVNTQRGGNGFGSRRNDNGNGFGSRQSSTRTTVKTPDNSTSHSGSGFGTRSETLTSSPRSTFKPVGSTQSSNRVSFGSSVRSDSPSSSSSSFGSSRSNSSRSSSSFGSSRSSSSFGSSRSSSSFGSSRSSSSRSSSSSSSHGGGFGSRR